MADLFPDPQWRSQGTAYPSRARRGSSFGKLALLGVLLLVVVGGVTYGLLKRSVVLETVPPTIHAEVGPLKERPTDPGGVEVLHQDTTVYDRLDKPGRAKLEQLLPTAEQPNEALLAAATPVVEVPPAPALREEVAPVEPDSAVKSAAESGAVFAKQEEIAVAPVAEPVAPTKIIVAVPEPKLVPSPPAEKPAAAAEQPFKAPVVVAPKPVTATKPEAKPAPRSVEKIIAEKKSAEVADEAPEAKATMLAKPVVKTPEPKPVEAAADEPLDVVGILAKSGVDASGDPVPKAAKVVPAANAVPLVKGMARVQLASSPDAAAVEKKMMALVSKHAGLLRSTRLSTVRADLGSKGVYYRIQTQALPGAEAAQLCARLKAAGQECLLVKHN